VTPTVTAQGDTMRPRRLSAVVLSIIVVLTAFQFGRPRDGWSYVIGNFWPDANNIVMDDVFLPAATWSAPAQFQLSEWNEVDTTDNSHPFRISTSPVFSFSADDGRSTMGFLGEAGLNSVYGLSYASALAWTVCFINSSTGRYDECDMMLNSALAWQLVPDANNFFQSTVLHEAGHIRGLDHYNSYLSMQNSGTDKILRGETLYMDDKEGVRQNATHVQEYDMVIYNKYHNGSVPLWMTSSPTTARVGDTITFNNITVENRGTFATGPLRFGAYMSTNSIISTGDQLLNSGTYPSFGRFTFSTFNWSVGVPFVNDCGTYYFGGVIDDLNNYIERFEGNNAVAFSNGSPDPQPFSILLERDSLEPNDSFAAARAISLPFSHGSLSLDSDADQDFYKFTLAQQSDVSIGIAFSHASGDVDMDLRNSGNTVLQSSTSTSNSETINRNLAAGTYYVRVFGFGGGSCNRYSMTVTATPYVTPVMTIAATDPSASEAGPDPGVFTVSRTGSTTAALTVNYSVGGTATNGTDYTALSGTVFIAAGATSAPIVVTPVDDALIEGAQTVIVTLTAGSGYTLGTPKTATVTIADNDKPTVTITSPDPTATEEGATGGTFKVTRAGSTSGALMVFYTLTGTAAQGADYQTLPGSVNIPAGAASATFKVTPINDTTLEANETVVATLSANAAYVIGSPNNATVTIVDNDQKPTVTIIASDPTAAEAGLASGAFKVTRTGSKSTALTVLYTLAGTASNGADYKTLTGSVKIAVGAASATFKVVPINDTLAEANETVVATLSANSAYIVGAPSSAMVTIVDND